MKKLLKDTLSTIVLTFTTTIMFYLTMNIIEQWDFESSKNKLSVMKQKIFSIVKSVKK